MSIVKIAISGGSNFVFLFFFAEADSSGRDRTTWQVVNKGELTWKVGISFVSVLLAQFLPLRGHKFVTI